MKVTVKVEGLAELDKALRELLPACVRGRPLRAAVAAGARIVAKEAKARVPVDSGLVKSRIRVMSNPQQQKQARAESVVGVRRSGKARKDQDPYYWRFVEFGTRKMRARPFLRPALEAKRNEATQMIRERLAKRIEAEVAKLRRP